MISLPLRQGFLPHLEGTFLAIFHPLQGPRVLFQIPEDLFIDHEHGEEAEDRAELHTWLPKKSGSQRRDQIEFSALSDYVIPKTPLCGRMIICNVGSCADEDGHRRSYKVLGLPVLIEHAQKYERNHFIFNLCFVFDARTEIQAYEPIVHKCARSLRMLEEQDSFVSRLENLPRLYGIVEQLSEDLNAYYEAFIALPEDSRTKRDESTSRDRPEHASTPDHRCAQPNLTLVDPAELDELIRRASGPLAQTRQEQRDSIWSLGEGSLSHETDATTDERSRQQNIQEPWLQTRRHDFSPLIPRGRPHGLGRTVREAINLKLFPTFPNPPAVHDWDVPVLLLDMGKYMNNGWDLSLVKLLPYMDGTNHVKRISQLSDTDLPLVQQCIQHLLYYSFAIVIDIFQFSNVYVVRPQIARVLDDHDTELECASYVARPGYEPLPGPTLWRMYSMLRHGRTLHEWTELLGSHVHVIDVRRFITYGVIKGFIRRVHHYPLYLPPPSPLAFSELPGRPSEEVSQRLHSNQSLSAVPYENQGPSSLHGLTSSMPDLPTPAAAAAAPPPPPPPPTGGGGSAGETLLSAEASGTFAPTVATESNRPKDLHHHRLIRSLSRSASAHRPVATAVDVGSIAHEVNANVQMEEKKIHLSDSGSLRHMQSATSSAGILCDLPALLDGFHCDDELCVRFGMSWSDIQRHFVSLSMPSDSKQDPGSRCGSSENDLPTPRSEWPSTFPSPTPTMTTAPYPHRLRTNSSDLLDLHAMPPKNHSGHHDGGRVAIIAI